MQHPFTRRYALIKVNEEDLKCLICKEQYSHCEYFDRAPVQLIPCGHFLCITCATDIYNSNKEEPKCPKCEEKFKTDRCIVMGAEELRFHVIREMDEVDYHHKRVVDAELLLGEKKLCTKCYGNIVDGTDEFRTTIVSATQISESERGLIGSQKMAKMGIVTTNTTTTTSATTTTTIATTKNGGEDKRNNKRTADSITKPVGDGLPEELFWKSGKSRKSYCDRENPCKYCTKYLESEKRGEASSSRKGCCARPLDKISPRRNHKQDQSSVIIIN
jgi:hypothetical protein